ncbi:hypothetical protein HYG77_37660 (plasmid) [Rhodococcus sp. ZPP]|uniref:hypothetical protein n=1 Tax=Rhodococcus TaxID=1827 RepID=UPI0006BB472A|nr:MULTISPECIES: hypothetical protein [Rhodococcus]QHE73669.1 hypothetical protein GFS60_07332 [Rhodococcus sp. WAY2]QTJ71171.1 hypothetical protein HYG77_37660 [Rhodococcus sp. ZPP]
MVQTVNAVPTEPAIGGMVSWTVRPGVYVVTACSRGSVTLMPAAPERYATPEGGWFTHPSKLREVDFAEVGRTAHDEGDPLSPALSSVVRRALSGLAVGDESGRKIMSDFVDGWLDAKLAQRGQRDQRDQKADQ